METCVLLDYQIYFEYDFFIYCQSVLYIYIYFLSILFSNIVQGLENAVKNLD